MSKVITFKTHHLDLLKKVMAYPMKFQKGRVRNKFLAILIPQIKLVEQSRMEIIGKLADKNPKNGLPLVEDGAYVFSDANIEKFNKQFVELMNEECIIDVPASIERDLSAVKEIINATTVELDERETGFVEDILEAISSVGPLPEVKKAKKLDKKSK